MNTREDIPTLSQANRLLRSGNIEEALAAYAQLQPAMKDLAHVIAINVEIAQRRLRHSTRSAVPKAKPTAEHSPAPRVSSTYLTDLYHQIATTLGGRSPRFHKSEAPLISVVVTSHNTSQYIEHCLESLLSQSYPNKEIIVVDDASDDDTCTIVRRVARANGGIRLFQLNANLGTYFAKNLGILNAKGDVIFFQDSDDISHPQRLALQMETLLGSSALVVRGAYSRVDPDNERVIPVNGLISKLGLITLGVKRVVFDRIGFFNCTTKASDDEFFNRITHYLGKGAVVNLDLPLYYNTMREGSLFADMVAWNSDGSIEQKPSPARAAYVETFRQLHSTIDASKVPDTFHFPRVRDALRVHSEMTKLGNPDVPVIVNVCSIPERESKLRRTLNSIARQCDRINVYLDRYEKVPEFLRRLPTSVEIVRSQDLPGLRDNGKFLALQNHLARGEDVYYLTIDDDIEYPADYVNAAIKFLKRFNDSVAVGVHGVTLKNSPRGYFSDRRMVHVFSKALERSTLVNVLGTGTTAFRSRLFDGFTLSKFEKPGMADIYFAVECKHRGVPLVCISRPENWLRDLGEGDGNTLYSEFKGDDRLQTELLQSSGPWGYQAIADLLTAVRSRDPGLHERLAPLMPALRSATRQ